MAVYKDRMTTVILSGANLCHFDRTIDNCHPERSVSGVEGSETNYINN